MDGAGGVYVHNLSDGKQQRGCVEDGADCNVGTSSVFITLYMNPFMSHLVSEQKGN